MNQNHLTSYLEREEGAQESYDQSADPEVTERDNLVRRRNVVKNQLGTDQPFLSVILWDSWRRFHGLEACLNTNAKLDLIFFCPNCTGTTCIEWVDAILTYLKCPRLGNFLLIYLIATSSSLCAKPS